MRPKNCLGAAMLAAVLGMGAMHATAQIPQSPGLPVATGAPSTLFKFLGLQKLRIARDSLINKKGKFPSLERKPPVLRIADPKNLESKNPAIKKAAEIKVEEDMAPQKIKAISYLSRMGCGCYEGVAEALIAALEDCTEEVRYAAAKALRDAAGEKCSTCNGSCCSEKVTDALYKLAYEKDDKCCWVEPSARVRDMARQALAGCSTPGLPSTPLPTPVRVKGEGPMGEDAPPPTPMPPPAASRLPKAPAVLSSIEPAAPVTQYVQKDVVEHAEPAVAKNEPAKIESAAEAHEDLDPPPALPASVVKAVERQAKLAERSPAKVEPLAPVFEEAAEESVTVEVESPAVVTEVVESPAVESEVVESEVVESPAIEAEVVESPVVEVEAPVAAKPALVEPARDEEGLTSEQREEVDAALKLFQAGEEEQAATEEETEAPAEEEPRKEASKPTRLPALTAVAKPEPKVEAKPEKAAKQTAAGQVVMVHPNGTVQLQFAGQVPTIGSQLKVTHQGLIRTITVGELQVVGYRGQFVYAKPTGNMNMAQLVKGDAAQILKLAPAAVAPVAVARTEQAIEKPMTITKRASRPSAPAAEVAIADERPVARRQQSQVQPPLPPAPKSRDVVPVKNDSIPERVGPAIWGVDE